ncbi:MAG TPA: YsnF/AvaK domain-containing protein, partial [Desulfosporosinus sp.]
IEEQKIVDVPVTREQVVIERRTLNNEQSDSPITDEETIRIPVSEEKVDVDKHTVLTGEISAHLRDVEDTKHIEETLRREEARVNTNGNPNVVDRASDLH